MDTSKSEKRNFSEEGYGDLKPVLVKIDPNARTRDIMIDKDEFSIGRAKENDEIILDINISRNHCIIRSIGNNDWIIKDKSSSGTLINGNVLEKGVEFKLNKGDQVQFGSSEEFKYVVTFVTMPEHPIKRQRVDEQILETVLTEQKTFAENQALQRKELKDKLETKQKEQEDLKAQLEELLKQQNAAIEDKEDLIRQIAALKTQIDAVNAQEQNLQKVYTELLQELENERVKFEARLNEERTKWQEALDLSKQEKEELEVKMKQQMEIWREQQQIEWKTMMEMKVRKERTIQVKLLNEKYELEQKLKKTEKALDEEKAKATELQAINGNCIIFDIINAGEIQNFEVMETIDLTIDSPAPTNPIVAQKESVFNKVNDIMDEQFGCSICAELFIKATTLNCTHTFCYFCIHTWNKKKKECPICRAKIFSMNRALVLDNFIDTIVENLPKDKQEKRKEIIQERSIAEKRKKIF
ncbi:E3 ubiquitin-protein ligase rnf8-B-like [Prorops nasuta]|uniref:E3 ubiquitin-protein ligase rnf8-B-like n=1 Tax=Prorops nasuta TaxID=863751 RepID=UPI0034CD7DB7